MPGTVDNRIDFEKRRRAKASGAGNGKARGASAPRPDPSAAGPDKPADKGANKLKRAAWWIFFAAMAFIFAQPLANALEGPYLMIRMRTAPVRFGTLETGTKTTGIMVRDESVVMSPISGTVRLFVKEGERVRKGTRILEVVDSELKEHVTPEIGKVEDELKDFDLSDLQRKEELKRKIADTESEIEDNRLIMQSKTGTEGAAARSRFSEGIGRLKSLQEQLQKLEDTTQSRRDSIKGKRESVWAAMAQSKFAYMATMSGIVSYKTDDLEGVLNLRSKKGELSRILEKLCESDASGVAPSHSATSDLDDIRSGQRLARIVNNFKAYVAVILSASEAEDLDGHRVRIRFSSLPGQSFAGSFYESLPSGTEGQSVCLFSLDEYVDGFNDLRRDRVEVIYTYKEGTIVPSSSISARDGYKGVYLVKKGFPVFQRVEVGGESGDECVVSGIPVGTRVVVNPGVIHG